MNRRHVPDLAVIALLFLLPLSVFWAQTIGGRTLLPTENLYQYEPYRTARAEAGAPEIPHNHLLSDLVLQNYPFKLFIRQQLAQGELPLWNPHQFSGIAFFAAGQQSTLYPFSILFYLLDLPTAYGWFMVAQLWLAGVFMFLFARGLGISRLGAAVAGITFQLAGFFVISAVFPMIVAAGIWLPLILLMIECIIHQRRAFRRDATPLWATFGALALGCVVLAGHVEITYYTLLIAAFYAAGRLLTHPAGDEAARPGWRGWLAARAGRAAWLVALVSLGMLLGAVQFLPTLEAANASFRSGRATFEQVLGYAHPPRDLLLFFMPNFYGNPAHHAVFDWFTGANIPVTVNALGAAITHTEWGEKNYVEGALYVGILPLILAGYAVITARGRARALILVFAALALLSLSFMFGLPTYGLLYYGLPGVNQLHSPFRWVFALTLCVAVLAGFGIDRWLDGGGRLRRLPALLWAAGALILSGLALSRAFYGTLEPLIDRAFAALARADGAFADAYQFYNYQFTNVLILGAMLAAAGTTLWLLRRWAGGRRQGMAGVITVAIVALDLMIASWGFNPASDPALLRYTPPAVEYLNAIVGDWRFTTLETPGRPAILNANLGMYHGYHDVRGYESIIPRRYVEFMQGFSPQNQLIFNRVAPVWTTDSYEDILAAPEWDALNVRYLITYADQDVDAPGWSLAYRDDAVRIYENAEALPFAFTAQAASTSSPRAAAVTWVSARELLVSVEARLGDTLRISQSYDPGWRAFIRPAGAGEDDETQIAVFAAEDALLGVLLPETGAWTVRLVYSPTSVQVGAFASFIAAALLVLVVAAWAWRGLVRPAEALDATGRVARNSIVPILLNLFNRGIDFAFAAVMLRLLGPELSGWYYYAIVLFGWFDIFTNFGLNLFVVREVARDRSQAGRLLFNTSALRLALAALGVPLLAAFLWARLSDTSSPVPAEALIAIVLLYIGLVPNSLSTGLTALFYAFERAEIPAAVTTLATIFKAVFGLAALLAGWSIIGLAGASIATNLITLGVLAWNARGLLPKAAPQNAGDADQRRLDFPLIRGMARQSYPLMLNHFLATIFFKIDIILIEAIHTATMVGQYSVAYKWVEALNIIPSFFTQALLPVLSRQAHDDRPAFLRNYRLGIKLLFILALPTAVAFTALAYTLTDLLGGAQFLPDGAIALQLMIWSIPIGWLNSLTQYALIALDMQRRITWAFAAGVGFNILTNLLFIPQYGYRAAALTTIASEAVLFVAFAWLLQRALGGGDWLALLWKPALAGAVMLLVVGAGWEAASFGALAAAAAAYCGALYWLHPFSGEEQARLLPLLPGRLRALILRRAG